MNTKSSALSLFAKLVFALTLALVWAISSQAQVKIGNNPTVLTPSAILETESSNKGFLKPRLTTAQRTAIASPATGLEVYDTDTQSTWYYNGTVWVNAGNSVNLYTADGTLAGTRTVTQGANTLAFTGSATNAFSVDGSTFSVDAANNAVGFGTASPNANAVVDATAVNKGVLLPRLALSATNNASPLSAFVAGMTVYNTATASSGTATAVTPGLYYSDGTKWIPTGKDYVEDPTLGSIAVFPYNALPSGYLECNGAAVSRTVYAGLFAKVGTTYGAGDGSTTFNLPDLRGEFIRGWDNGRGVDAGRTLGSSQTVSTKLPTAGFTVSTAAAHTHDVDPPSTASSTAGSHSHTTGGAIANGTTNAQTGDPGGGNFGLIQRSSGGVNTTDGVLDTSPGEPNLVTMPQNHYHTTDAQGSHSHTVDIASVTSSASGAHSHTITGGDAETRPRNVAMVYAIKATESVLVPSSTSSAVSAAAAANEPWYKVGTTTGATSNTDNVYLMGNVGINTSTPAVRLDARGSIHFDDAGTASANIQGGYLTWNRTALGGSGQGYFGFLNHQGVGSGGFVFSTTTDNATFSEKMRITGNGLVGIGTNIPPCQFSNTDATTNYLNSLAQGYGDKTMYWTANNNGNAGTFVNLSTNPTASGLMVKVASSSTFAAALDVSRGSGNAAGTPLFTVLSTGDVGVGTNTPNAPLQFANTIVNRKIVLWEGTNNDHQYFGLGINNSTLRYQVAGTGDSHVFFVGTGSSTSSELMRINGTGTVGIGTASPNAKLHVNGTAGSGSSATYRYYDIAGFTTFPGDGGVGKFSIYASSVIATGFEFRAFSDRRIKQYVSPVDHASSLDIVRQLNIVHYSYKDKMKYGNTVKTGVFAQDVQKVFPEAVDSITEFIPNIYKSADAAGNSLTGINTSELAVGDLLKIYVDENGEEVEKLVTVKALSANGVELKESLSAGKVFVFGKQVKDFLNLDYDRLTILGLSALKDLAQQHAAVKETMERQQSTIDLQQAQIKALKAELDAIKAMLQKSNK